MPRCLECLAEANLQLKSFIRLLNLGFINLNKQIKTIHHKINSAEVTDCVYVYVQWTYYSALV